LKKAASEESEESKKSNDTPIEVLEEGLDPSQTNNNQAQSSGSNPFQENNENSNSVQQASVSNEGLEKKLDKIIEQNAEMIKVLKSFGQ